jgi:hypothetical protein
MPAQLGPGDFARAGGEDYQKTPIFDAKDERSDDLLRSETALRGGLLERQDRVTVKVQDVGNTFLVEGLRDGGGGHAWILQWSAVGGQSAAVPFH